ncbi:MAG: type II secretion system minor pseudopilin GspJ [Gammaproteobacteria bacterium]|nr:type II secretion system minor pseudopilin GspJ [Gammaproteobacteria bacterium]
MTIKRQHGFTLLELVVATAIFFIMSAMLYAVLDSVRRQLVFSEEASDSLRELHYAMRRMALDLSQLQPRPVRDELGSGWQDSISAGSGSNAIEISVGGWRNPMALPRGSVQRVAYTVDGDVLARLHWPVLDRTLAAEPLRTDLLTGIRDIQVRFLDASGEWSEQWPPFGAGPDNTRARPRAIEIFIDHEQWGELTRIVEITG